ncbi:HNH endonuclease [Fictibacillus sp. KU28468]|uniref:HNH endonuclease n=1 Tax=Fictibacillus sp. KU28468 TaxID=2991053 RepID=UPI00223D1DCA|nr:HNH endonuclease [Fictibacillus sp. KU28468]UZJ78756.1 HNH endonuclease [Fictibacillus sp. KU28468]
MSRVILQPTGNKDAREHYVDTLVRPVDILRIKPFVSSEEYNYLKDMYPDGLVPTWGVTPGVNNVNANKWSKIQPADVTFFSANKILYSYGFVTFKIQNKQLAQNLWGFNIKGETWEYIYFLDEIREHDIQISLFNKVVDYAENYKVQGFAVLDEDKSESVLSYFGLHSETVIQPVSEVEYQNIIENFDWKDLDTEGKSKSRAEQGFLRTTLFRNKTTSNCGICGKEYPISFLVAAHIKKRSLCSKEEKLDFKNIIMPMCKFGCDDLFEKGYITILNGTVKSNGKTSTEALENYLNSIVGKKCDYWNESTVNYFEWHRHHHSLSKVR